MNRKTETAELPYADRPMWLYSRSSDKRVSVLIHDKIKKIMKRLPRGEI